MKIIYLNEHNEEKYVKLLRRIDSGEYDLCKNYDKHDDFVSWIFKIGIDLKDNYGVITASIYKQNLRIQISFDSDVNEDAVDGLMAYINEAIDAVELDNVDFWCNNSNQKLVELLKSRYDFNPHVYMSHEFHYHYKDFVYRNIKPLVAKTYHKKYLDDILELLEKSFVDIAIRGEFVSNKEYYHHKFSNNDKSSCEVFLFNEQVIGMYAQNDGDLEYIAILPELQNYGFGAKVLNHALNAMKNNVDRTPFLYCVDSNSKANRFYIKQGWELTGRSAWLQLKLNKNI